MARRKDACPRTPCDVLGDATSNWRRNNDEFDSTISADERLGHGNAFWHDYPIRRSAAISRSNHGPGCEGRRVVRHPLRDLPLALAPKKKLLHLRTAHADCVASHGSGLLLHGGCSGLYPGVLHRSTLHDFPLRDVRSIDRRILLALLRISHQVCFRSVRRRDRTLLRTLTGTTSPSHFGSEPSRQCEFVPP